MSKQNLMIEVIGAVMFVIYWAVLIAVLSFTAAGKAPTLDTNQSQSAPVTVGPPH